MKVTEEEKQIKIAEACGVQITYFRFWYQSHKGYKWWDCLPTFGEAKKTWGYYGDQGRDVEEYTETKFLPNYFNDLNAMRSAWEIKIQGHEDLEDQYSIELLRAIGQADPADGTRPNGSASAWALASNATAAQRAEAFGRVFNLWEATA